jgi:uncharacterized membrane protein
MWDQLSVSERSRSWRLRFRLREWLARSLLVVPCLYIVVALVLGELIPRIEGDRDILSLELDEDSARTFLSAVAGGMISFTGLVVSIAVVVVQFGASQFTPRLVGGFRRDPVVKHSLGIFIAPAIFALASLRNIGREDSTVVPSLTLGINFLLLIVAVVAFFLLVSRLLDLLRPRRIVAQVVDRAKRGVREAYPFPFGQTPPHQPPATEGVETTVLSHEGRAGVLSALDRARIVRAATAADVLVEVQIGIGGFVPPDAPLFVVHGPADRLDAPQLRRSAILAEERTVTQDPAFALRAIVDIALRALSPAVNDPTTAVHILDGIEVLLLDLALRDLARGRIDDEQGTLRLVYPNLGWEALLDLSLTEIRHYGADSPQVARRLRALLLSLIESTPSKRHPALEAQLARLDSAVRSAYADPVERAHAEVPDHLGLGHAVGER